MKQFEIKGIIPPVITPMNPEDESVNIPELRNQIERQIAGGVHGIFPFGTNGEAYILSLKEKEEILEAAVDQVKGRIPVYAGTGCISTRDTVYLSKRAEELGADALSIITPSFALASQKELYDHYCEVAKHVNIPSMFNGACIHLRWPGAAFPAVTVRQGELEGLPPSQREPLEELGALIPGSLYLQAAGDTLTVLLRGRFLGFPLNPLMPLTEKTLAVNPFPDLEKTLAFARAMRLGR